VDRHPPATTAAIPDGIRLVPSLTVPDSHTNFDTIAESVELTTTAYPDSARNHSADLATVATATATATHTSSCGQPLHAVLKEIGLHPNCGETENEGELKSPNRKPPLAPAKKA
jgi:hypothetical protein